MAYSFQLTGLYFLEDDGMHSFDRVINSIISASKRNDPVNYKKISDKMLRLCYSRDLSPHMVNRYFFLLGSDFCQNLKCDECFLSESCYLFPYDSVYFKAQFPTQIYFFIYTHLKLMCYAYISWLINAIKGCSPLYPYSNSVSYI